MDPRQIKHLFLLAGIFLPVLTIAATEADFEVETTKNLVNLCSAAPDDPLFDKAIHFCHGYLVGAFHYHMAENKGPDAAPLVCFPKPEPTRNEIIGKILVWIQQHPQYDQELPVETEFRALHALWPCKKQ